ncbi:glycosyltransferase, partial [Pseudoflavonifractor sp. 524-17]|uniref:glycosyltransferase n=1 Tax=Pseudoflavonifractor sp. 524-17 TaxID=2304577 RepID=UPI00137B3F10
MSRKVLYTASTYSHIAHFHLPYLREFQRAGWEVHIACAGAPEAAPDTDKSIALPFKKQMGAPDNFRAARMLRGIIRAGGYELIVTHTSLASFFTRLAVKGMRPRPRLINMVHGYLFDDDTPLLKRQLLLNAERFTAPETDLVLTMNQYDYGAAKKYRLGKQVDNIPGIGVDFGRLDGDRNREAAISRQDLGISPKAFVLIYAAEFSRRKSQDVLLRAMTYLPEETVLILCGDGAELERCRALAKGCGVDRRVLFPGRVQNMAAWYALADAAVTASRSEGLPFNVMEAMYCGLPVVASRVKGHTDLIEDGTTGLLYDYSDGKACAGKIRCLMNSPALRDMLAANARQSVARFDLSRVLSTVLTAYG